MQDDGCGTCGAYCLRNQGTNIDATVTRTARTRTTFEVLERRTTTNDCAQAGRAEGVQYGTGTESRPCLGHCCSALFSRASDIVVLPPVSKFRCRLAHKSPVL